MYTYSLHVFIIHSFINMHIWKLLWTFFFLFVLLFLFFYFCVHCVRVFHRKIFYVFTLSLADWLMVAFSVRFNTVLFMVFLVLELHLIQETLTFLDPRINHETSKPQIKTNPMASNSINIETVGIQYDHLLKSFKFFHKPQNDI